MIELIEIINKSVTKEDKIYSLLGRIIEITESQNGILFINDNEDILGNIQEKFLRVDG